MRFKTLLKILFFLHFTSTVSNAQCPGSSAGPSGGSTFGNDASIGSIAWSNPNSCSAADGNRSVGAALALGNVTNYLTITGFGFSVPATAVICGISIEVRKSATGLLQNVTDNSVRLIVGGSITGNNKAAAGSWPSSDTYSTYGGNGDLWGATLTPADINSANFGVAIAASLNGISVLPSARIDYARITVHYSAPLPVELLKFEAKPFQKGIALNWATASETNVSHFRLERSTDGLNFSRLTDVKAKGNNTRSEVYSHFDAEALKGMYYYRLKEVDYNGNEQVLQLSSIALNTEKLSVYPNPVEAGKSFTLNIPGADNGECTVIISNISGNEVFHQTAQVKDGSSSDIMPGELPPGLYYLTFYGPSFVLQSKLFIK